MNNGQTVDERRCHLHVDFSERNAALLGLARRCGSFDVRMVRLPIGDYLIDGGVLVERKTYADFATSLADGRLFLQAAALEPELADASPGEHFQFERQGYFVVDSAEAGARQPNFLRTVSLRDSWAKLERQALQDVQR